jgi:hypothetical protein
MVHPNKVQARIKKKNQKNTKFINIMCNVRVMNFFSLKTIS